MANFGKDVNVTGELQVQGTGSFGSDVTVEGQVTSVGPMNAPAFNQTSDARYKYNICPISPLHALNVVSQMRPVQFNWTDSYERADGFIAQDIQQLIYHAVSTDANGMLSLNYSMLIPWLVAAIQHQQDEIERIKQQLNIE
jgi:hypothetical protein